MCESHTWGMDYKSNNCHEISHAIATINANILMSLNITFSSPSLLAIRKQIRAIAQKLIPIIKRMFLVFSKLSSLVISAKTF